MASEGERVGVEATMIDGSFWTVDCALEVVWSKDKRRAKAKGMNVKGFEREVICDRMFVWV